MMSNATAATHHYSFITHPADIYKPLFMKGICHLNGKVISSEQARRPAGTPDNYRDSINHLLSGERQEM